MLFSTGYLLSELHFKGQFLIVGPYSDYFSSEPLALRNMAVKGEKHTGGLVQDWMTTNDDTGAGNRPALNNPVVPQVSPDTKHKLIRSHCSGCLGVLLTEIASCSFSSHSMCNLLPSRWFAASPFALRVLHSRLAVISA